MESLYPKRLVIDSLRKYISGVNFEDPRLTEEKKLMLTLDSLFGLELNDFITEYLYGEKPTYPLF